MPRTCPLTGKQILEDGESVGFNMMMFDGKPITRLKDEDGWLNMDLAFMDTARAGKQRSADYQQGLADVARENSLRQSFDAANAARRAQGMAPHPESEFQRISARQQHVDGLSAKPDPHAAARAIRDAANRSRHANRGA